MLQCMDGKKALGLVEEHKPDLVLMDIQMPGISGLEVTDLIRKTPVVADTKIIAVTAFAMKGDEQKIIDGGCDGYSWCHRGRHGGADRKQRRADHYGGGGRRDGPHIQLRIYLRYRQTCSPLLSRKRRNRPSVPLFAGYTDIKNRED